MRERDASSRSEPVAAMLAELPTVCRLARAPDQAFAFLPELSRRLLPHVPHDAMAIVWTADDERSYRVVAGVTDGEPVAAGERRARPVLVQSPIRAAFESRVVSVADVDALRKGDAASVPAGELPLPGCRVVVAIPFLHDDDCRGALVLGRRGGGAFADEQTNLLVDVGSRILPFVEAAMLLAHMAEQDRRRRSFQALHQAMAGSLDVRKVFDDVVAAVRPVFAFDVMGVELMTPSQRTSERIVEVGGEGLLPRIRTIDDFSVASQILSGKSVLVHDTWTDIDSSRPGDRILLDAGIRSFVLVPLVFPLSQAENATGVIYMAKREPFWFDALDVETLQGLADPITLAIHHHRRVEQNRRVAAAEERTALLQERLASLRQELGTRYGFEHILGRSTSLREVLGRATKVAPTETTVLLTGESGTGKELFAHAIHLASPRAEGPFVALNCAALLESELFGHEKGAFTGALKRKPGRFELAAGGTLFLDEVGELALPVQAKLLRVLQQREFESVGGTATQKADVRLVAATNRDLAAEVASGRFREDLLYRLNVFQLHLPPLRARGDDVLVLAEHFVRELEARMGKSVPGISQEARRVLLEYPWPGNIRELQNAIERAMILSDGGLIQSSLLGLDPAKVAGARAAATASATVGEGDALGVGQLSDWERRLVVEALQKAGGNKSKAADILGVTRSQLYTRMKRFGL